MIYDKKFDNEVKKRIKDFSENKKLLVCSSEFNEQASLAKYTYNFKWLGVPVIQYPQDLVVMQELIFNLKPDLIIETGVARAGSLIFYSSLLSLIHKKYKIIGIDIEIRKHAKKVLSKHKFSKNIVTFEKSSTDNNIIKKIHSIAKKYKKILVCLDSDHTHEHVLNEMNLYCKFVSKNSYLVVFDTSQAFFKKEIINHMAKSYSYKPWGHKSNPYTAVKEFLVNNKNFKIENYYDKKSLITNARNGFLKRIK